MRRQGRNICWWCLAKLPPLLAVTCYGFQGYVFHWLVLPWLDANHLKRNLHGVVAYNLLWCLSFTAFLRGCLSDGRVPADWWMHQEPAPMLQGDWSVMPCRFCGPRPARSHHCRSCGTCVWRMDHHCPWMDNCVSLQNHKFFLQCCLYGCGGAAMFLAHAAPLREQLCHVLLPPVRLPRWELMGSEQQQLMHEAGLISIGCGLACSFLVALGGLFVDGFSKVLRNRTSIEARFTGANPYDLGMLSNLQQTLGPWHTWTLPVRPWCKRMEPLEPMA